MNQFITQSGNGNEPPPDQAAAAEVPAEVAADEAEAEAAPAAPAEPTAPAAA